MSKFVVYVLDKIVWMLLATVFTTQALQIAGIMEAPKSMGEISYEDGNSYSFQLGLENADRGKREVTERSQFIDTLFNRFRRGNTSTKNQNIFVEMKNRAAVYILKQIVYSSTGVEIPIKTLTAVNNLIQNSRPAFAKLRDFAVNRLEKRTSTTAAPVTEASKVEKRSYPVYIRPKETKN